MDGIMKSAKRHLPRSYRLVVNGSSKPFEMHITKPWHKSYWSFMGKADARCVYLDPEMLAFGNDCINCKWLQTEQVLSDLKSGNERETCFFTYSVCKYKFWSVYCSNWFIIVIYSSLDSSPMPSWVSLTWREGGKRPKNPWNWPRLTEQSKVNLYFMLEERRFWSC